MSGPVLELGDVTIRLAVAAGLGALIGLEREVQGQVAGMRTNALAAVGAALFTLVGAYGFVGLTPSTTVDPMRVAAQVVSGIGFIGAGAILRDGGSVRGITTAAALWASAGLGMAAGAGQTSVACAGAGVVLVALLGLRFVRDHGVHRVVGRLQTIDVTYERGHGTLAPIIGAVEASGGSLRGIEIDDRPDERHVRLVIMVRHAEHLRHGVGALSDLPEVTDVRLATG